MAEPHAGRELNKVQRTSAFYCRGRSAKHSSKRQLHLVNVVAVVASKYAHAYAFSLIRKIYKKLYDLVAISFIHVKPYILIRKANATKECGNDVRELRC